MILPSRMLLDAALLDLSLTTLVATFFLARQTRATTIGADPAVARQIGPVWGGAAVAGLIAALITGNVLGALVATIVTLLAASIAGWMLPRLSTAGALSLVAQPLTMLCALPWFLLVLDGLAFPDWAMIAVLATGAVGLLLLGFTMAGSLVRQATMTHVEWRRPNRPLPALTGDVGPMVSVQVPCYAEPPELVIATLDRIAAQSYTNYEVMVCDNNTKDEALWRPVEAHCRRLNQKIGKERFRFFHVSPLGGAKAGALNWLMPRMAREAKLVAVLDADYEAEPDFLARLIGFFDDPRIGYVQTPHDYRDYEGSAYLRGCYWEYMPTNKVVYPGINEYDAPFTIGTMCVLRADAIREAGGWAEWCLTEDSEISVRLRALGYDGLYLPQTFGRGLIPETFEDYRKQRFRWVAGPVQQLRRYWRYFLPRPFGAPSGINSWSKLLEFQRSAAPIVQLATFVAGTLGMIVTMVLSATGALPDLVLPGVAWMVLLSGIATSLLSRWMRYRMSGCVQIADMARGELAQASLIWVQMTAAIAGLSSRPQAWTRTPKFAAEGSFSRAFNATLPEIVVGGTHVALFLLFLVFAGEIGGHLMAIGGGGLLFSGARFLAAPAMALLGERDLALRADRERQQAARFATLARRRAVWKAA